MSICPFADVVVLTSGAMYFQQDVALALQFWRWAYFAAVAAFSINAATSCACERKIAWLPGSSTVSEFGPLRHEPLEVRVDHPVLHGNYCVAWLLFPSRNRGLRVKCFACNRYLGYRHEARDRLGSVGGEIMVKRIGVDCQKAVTNWSDALGSRRHFVRQIRQNSRRRPVAWPLHRQEPWCRDAFPPR